MNMSLAEMEKLLKTLRLHGMITTLDTRIIQANQGASFTEVFACLVQDELDYRKSVSPKPASRHQASQNNPP